jgi:hypothetical protein
VNNAATSLPIVEQTDQDLTLEQAAALARRSPKTLRRAVHSGDLPRRYVLGPRGPQLVFDDGTLRTWIAARMPIGQEAASYEPARTRGETGDVAELVSTVSQLQRALQENRSVLAQLAARLRDQDGTVLQAQSTIDQLARQLAAHDPAGAARAAGEEPSAL